MSIFRYKTAQIWRINFRCLKAQIRWKQSAVEKVKFYEKTQISKSSNLWPNLVFQKLKLDEKNLNAKKLKIEKQTSQIWWTNYQLISWESSNGKKLKFDN